jgi:uncharacterized membrane protein
MSHKHFSAARDGGVSILTAASIGAMVMAGALAVDVGFLYLKSRQLQGVADLAAISAASQLENAQRAAEDTVHANTWGGRVRVDVTLGEYQPDPNRAPAQRFDRAGPRNAAQVRLSGRAPLFFGRLIVRDGALPVTRSATAAQTELAAFEIGSRLLSLRGGIANQVLGGLTGSNVNLSVMDYNALLSADVDLFTFVDALRTNARVNAATFDEALDARIQAGDALDAIADQLEARRDPAAAGMRQMANAAERTGAIDGLSELIDLGPYGDQDLAMAAESARVRVRAMDLANAILQIAGGERQVQLDLGAQVPGLARTRVWLAIGERPNQSPWLAITNDNQIILRTAQVRLYVEAETTTALAAVARVRIPILVEAASAEARLNDIQCGYDERDRRVTLDVSPSVGMLALADIDLNQLDNFRRELTLRRADLVRLPLITATGAARVDIGGHQWQQVVFRGEEIRTGIVKTVATRDIARATVSSLLGNLDLNVRVVGLGLGVGPVTNAIRPALTTAAAPLDGLINGLTDLLGVHVGEADVRVNGLRCDGAALVL